MGSIIIFLLFFFYPFAILKDEMYPGRHELRGARGTSPTPIFFQI